MSVMNLFRSLRTTLSRSLPLGTSRCFSSPTTIDSLVDVNEEEQEARSIIHAANSTISEKSASGRSFAVVHLMGKQYRVTDGDLLMLEGHWPPRLGDELRLEKVLLAATKDLTLIGRPLLAEDLVRVTATVVGKGISHTKTNFKKKPKKQYQRINFIKESQTTLRINRVQISPNLDSKPSLISR